MTCSVAILAFAHEEKEQCHERYAPESEQRPADHRRGRTTLGQYDGARDNRQQPETTNNSRYHDDSLPQGRGPNRPVVHLTPDEKSRRRDARAR
jgi:hypothetical protein